MQALSAPQKPPRVIRDDNLNSSVNLFIITPVLNHPLLLYRVSGYLFPRIHSFLQPQSQRHAAVSRPPASFLTSQGFTMVELITTLVLIGILMAVAVPRMLAPSPFKVRALADEIAAEIRYTQQLNMNYDADATFRIGACNGNGETCMYIYRGTDNCDNRLYLRSRQDDNPKASGSECPERELGGFDFSTIPDPFELSFSRLGRPSPGNIFAEVVIQLSGASQEANTLCVWPETGFVEVFRYEATCP